MNEHRQQPLEITWEQLNQVQALPSVQATRQVTTAAAQAAQTVSKAGGGSWLDQLLPTAIWQGVVAGIAGGLAAWVLQELIVGESTPAPRTMTEVYRIASLFGAAQAVGFSTAITLALAYLNQTTGQLVQRCLVSAAAGGLCGLFGGMIGQYLFSSLLSQSADPAMSTVIFARAVGWSLVGISAGLGQALTAGSGKRVANGCIGGAIGGAIGGLLFDVIANATETAVLSRFVGFLMMGIAIGGGIGLVSRLRRSAWLKVVDGPFYGKEFLIDTEETRIGRLGTCHIVLFKDHGLLPHHATIRATASGYQVEAAAGVTQIRVNDQTVTRKALRPGDTITMGSSTLRFMAHA